MSTIWLVPLTLLGNSSLPDENFTQYRTHAINNVSNELRNVRTSTEEVLLWNRHFVDYLMTIGNETLNRTSDSRCLLLTQQLADAYLRHQQHGLEWFDSWASIPTGLQYRNRHTFDNVNQCRGIEKVRMQYCTFSGKFPRGIQPLAMGLCIPQVCSSDFVRQLYGDYLETKGFQLKWAAEKQPHCIRDEEIQYDGAMVTAISVSILMGLVVLCATMYDLTTEALKRSPKPLYTAFSLASNFRSILQLVPRINAAKQKSDMIDCAHGIRSLSMIWIVVLHVNEFLRFVPWENEPSRLQYTKGFMSTVLHFSGSLAVDTFLALSGLLVAMTMLRELDKTGRFNALKFYLHRYIRITAPLAALILFVVSFAGYMGEGVFWKENIDKMKQPCMENWWAAMLHIQNYVDPGNMCLPWTWYLSVDMQLYVFAPALIYPLWRYGKRFLVVVVCFAVSSMACVLTTFYRNRFRLGFIAPGCNARRYILTYYATHARMAVWLWGLVFGYLLHKTKYTGVTLPRRYWAAGWISCYAFLGIIIYSNYQIQAKNVEDYPFVFDAFYESLSRSVFAFCVLWIVLACVNGKGWLVDEFLGAALWQPLSRMSFTMYLLHIPLLVMASVASAKTSSYFSMTELFYRIWGTFGLTTSVALLWSSVFELPFVMLSKLVIRG